MLAVVVGMIAVPAQGQIIFYYTKDYVIAERRGFEVAFNRFNMPRADADKRIKQEVARLGAEAAESRKANAVLDKEIKALKSKLFGLKAKLGLAKDDATKTETQAKIVETETQIQEKEGQFVPVVAWLVGGPFRIETDEADQWINNVKKQVEAQRAAAEAKEAAKQKADEGKKAN